MTSIFAKLLALTLSVLLTLPQGFCCYWSAITCCPHGPTTKVAGEKKAKSCCQHVRAKQSTPAAPPKPSEPPQPCKSPCCDRQPTTLVGKDAQLDHVALMVIGDVPTFVPTLHVCEPTLCEHVALESASLQALHCCWLC